MIPDDVRRELIGCGFDEAWEWSRRQTWLNCYWKLKELDLWRFVAAEEGTDLGKMHVRCHDIAGLRAALRTGNFRCRKDQTGEWDGSERVATASLHIKHFVGKGWAEDKVQVHIDHAGAWLHPAWWLFFPVPVVQLIRHGSKYDSYKDVPGALDLLLALGAPRWIACV